VRLSPGFFQIPTCPPLFSFLQTNLLYLPFGNISSSTGAIDAFFSPPLFGDSYDLKDSFPLPTIPGSLLNISFSTLGYCSVFSMQMPPPPGCFFFSPFPEGSFSLSRTRPLIPLIGLKQFPCCLEEIFRKRYSPPPRCALFILLSYFLFRSR